MNLIQQLQQRNNYLTTVEVMSRLNLSRATLCGWVRMGRISAVRMGNAYLFDPQVLAKITASSDRE